jgi:hypothetical protein
MRALLIAALLILPPASVFAQSLTVVGLDGKETVLTAAQMATLPRADVVLQQGKPAIYQGPTLASVFREAGVASGPRLHGKPLVAYVVVTGFDDYRAIFSVAELDVWFREGAIILADRRIDGPLAENEATWRLIVGADKRPERAVRQVVRIEVRAAP